MEERLQKLIARAGLTSRRRAEELIVQGRVQVNGRVVTELGTKADPEKDKITVDGRELPSPRRAYYLLHKPRGYVTTVRDPQGRPTVIDLVPARTRLFPVGRLDLDSEGLLLLTNDGELAYLLTHPRFQVEKVYEVWVRGYPAPKDLEALRRGVLLEDGPARAAKVEMLGSWQKGARLAVTMYEGRKREVRRLFAALGFEVERLIRRRLGPLELGDLPAGRARRLTPQEVASLYRAAGGKAFSLPKPGRDAAVREKIRGEARKDE
ncbi:MAG: rRNA synthase [Bacillota bacterium]|nr:rRNA synthase [Bacillota bacterium]MDK2926244.1 rRNA synthase [Bacillota bacterium]MDK2960583.1 rRNA synthase [Bacillota bacterium]